MGKLRPKIGHPNSSRTQTRVSAFWLGTHLGQLPLLVSLDPKAWDGGCGEAGTVGEPTQAADLGHGPQGLCGGSPGQLHLSLLVCRQGRVGLREAKLPARVVLPSLTQVPDFAKPWDQPIYFYLDQSKLRVEFLSGL